MNRRRLAVLPLALVILVGGVLPVAANEPVPPEAPPEQPTVHGEMLLEHADESFGFTPGAEPAGPAQAGGAIANAGSVTGLPNGLRREVFGYLPYWYLTDANLASLDLGLVSTVAFFGVAARSDGSLARTAQGATTAGWAGWNSSQMTAVTNEAHALGVKVVLTVTMMSWNGDYAEMTAFLNSSSARSRLVGEIVDTVRARRADGVNLDWEPVPSSLRDQYTSFVRQVKAGLSSAGVGNYVTVATTAGAASWTTGYDVAALAAPGAADALMVMAYDFSWSGSSRSGGVAPIDSPYIFDVREAMDAYRAKVPASKLIWGVPYYGRGWTTKDDTQNSPTCKTTSVCPVPPATSAAIGRTWAPRYVDAVSEAAAHGRRWDAAGQVPWFRYYDSGRKAWTAVYYDDAASIGAKYALVETNGLRGVGIWSLLMDVGRRDLWNVIDEVFQGTWFTDSIYSPFRGDIIWLADAGITGGCGPDLFCPNGNVTRGQMAAFLRRALELPPATRDHFRDDETSQFEDDINRLAEAGITGGCAADRFCPNSHVTRGQMAAFLRRAFELPAAGRDYFGDDERSPFEDDINRLAASGITSGCATARYCPNGLVTRGEMAAFLRRALS